MGPALDDLVHGLPRTLKGSQVPVTVQLVVLIQHIPPHSLLQQKSCGIKHLRGGLIHCKITHEGDTHGFRVVPKGVGSFVVPTLANVNGSVSSDQEVVPDVSIVYPYVIGLNVSHQGRTALLEKDIQVIHLIEDVGILSHLPEWNTAPQRCVQ